MNFRPPRRVLSRAPVVNSRQDGAAASRIRRSYDSIITCAGLVVVGMQLRENAAILCPEGRSKTGSRAVVE